MAPSEVTQFLRKTFNEFDFETSDLEIEVLKSSVWKHTTLCDKGVFSFIIISQLRRRIKLKFSQVCYFMCLLRNTGEKWEDAGLWQLSIVSTVFNMDGSTISTSIKSLPLLCTR